MNIERVDRVYGGVTTSYIILEDGVWRTAFNLESKDSCAMLQSIAKNAFELAIQNTWKVVNSSTLEVSWDEVIDI